MPGRPRYRRFAVFDLAQCIEDWNFPDPAQADAEGLLAWGGDLRPERLISGYARGIFPWYEAEPILWFSPDPRWVLEPSRLHVSRSLRLRIREARFELRFDTAFREVIEACAAVPRPGQAGTWITPEMVDAYVALHEKGVAHCVESWRDGQLVGGVYGVSLGAAFFGESMFALETDASKVAFVTLVERLQSFDFRLVDCQVQTDHLTRFGAEAWPRQRFLEVLGEVLRAPTVEGPWTLGRPLPG